MKDSDLKQQDTARLAALYAETAAEYGRALEHLSARAANRQADRVMAIYKELRDRGADAQSALLPLLDHVDPHVRRWAAFHAIEFAPQQAEVTLTDLRLSDNRIVRTLADIALQSPLLSTQPTKRANTP